MIKKLIFALGISLVLAVQVASAEMLLFTRESCIHCQNLENQLQEKALYEKYDIKQYEISKSKENFDLYFEKALQLNYRNGGVPWLVNGNDNIEGTNLIMAYLENLEQGDKPLKKTVLTSADSESLNSMIKQEVKQQDAKEGSKTSAAAKIIIFGLIGLITGLGGFFLVRRKIL